MACSLKLPHSHTSRHRLAKLDLASLCRALCQLSGFKCAPIIKVDKTGKLLQLTAHSLSMLLPACLCPLQSVCVNR